MIFNDLIKACRLCFNKEGENDVTTTPILLDAIKSFYNIEVCKEILNEKPKKIMLMTEMRTIYLF